MSDHQGNNVFVEIHALVSYAPSNLNRDDLGAPKTAVFGGVRRLRISSQCQKRSWRTADLFKHELAVEGERLGERTSKLGQAVIERLADEEDGDKKLSELERRGLDALLSSIGKAESSTEEKEKKPNEDGDNEDDEESAKTAHLLYLSVDEQRAVASFVTKHREVLAEVGEAMRAVEQKHKEAADKVNALLEDAKDRADGAKAEKVKDDAAKAKAEAKAAKEKAAKAKRDAAKAKKDDPALKKAGAQIDALRKKLTKHMLDYVPRSAVDVALFGRFLTKSEFREIDAAMQVAHALGTQKADIEYDYFTAMDDRTKEAAAGHIGETELAASVFYKYGACNMAVLVENLGPSGDEAKHADKEKDEEARKKVAEHRANAREIAARALRGIAFAMARVVPTGKKNSTAPQSPADYLEVVVRRDAPVSLVNAFLDPVRADRDGDVMQKSITRLQEHATVYDTMYGADAIDGRLVLSSRDRSKVSGPTGPLDKGERRVVASLADLGAALEATLLAVLPP